MVATLTRTTTTWERSDTSRGRPTWWAVQPDERQGLGARTVR